MPELPEVEHLRRSLVPHLVGARVLAANLLRDDIAQSHGVKGTPLNRTTKPQLLEGRTVTSLRRTATDQMAPALVLQAQIALRAS